MNDSLSPTQRLVLLKLLFTSETPLQSKIQPRLNTKERAELVSLGLIRLEQAGRGKKVTLTDKAWSWAPENLESKLVDSKYATPALQAVLRQLSGFLRTRSLSLADFFDTSARIQSGSSALPQSSAPQASVQQQVRRALLDLGQGRNHPMIRIADLKEALSDIPPEEVNEALLSMQKNGDVSLQTIESMQQTTEADRRAAIRILGEDRNIVYLEK